MSQDTQNSPSSAIIAKEEFRPIDISIAGTPHRIVCPVDEIKNLEHGLNTSTTKSVIYAVKSSTKPRLMKNFWYWFVWSFMMKSKP